MDCEKRQPMRLRWRAWHGGWYAEVGYFSYFIFRLTDEWLLNFDLGGAYYERVGGGYESVKAAKQAAQAHFEELWFELTEC